MKFVQTERGYHRAEGTAEEWHELKRAVFRKRNYVGRISMGFTARVVDVHGEYEEIECVLAELDHLEGLAEQSRTKPATQFRRKPLHPLWHKHYTTPRDIIPNIYSHCGILEIAERRKPPDTESRRFDRMFAEVAHECGDDPDVWPSVLVDRMIEGYFSRASQYRLTGNWIVFAEHRGKKFYLDIASHDEDDIELYAKLHRSAEAEFPFVFK